MAEVIDGLNQKNGGFTRVEDSSQRKTFFRASDRFTKPVTVKQGQVLRGLSFLESDAVGKVIAHSGLTEAAQVTFTALTAAQTLIMGGLTYTDGGAGTSVAELVAMYDGIADGEDGGVDPSTGTWSGTLSGWSIEKLSDTTVVFNASATNTNPTDLANTGTGTVTIVTASGSTGFPDIAGVLLFDVDATAGDVKATAFTKASFWSEILVWAVDISVDTITLADGTEVALTAYDTGCHGGSDESDLLKQKFVEGSGFTELGFLSDGEIA